MVKSIRPLLLIVLASISTCIWSEDWAYRLHEGETLTVVAERFLKSEITPDQLQLYNGIVDDRAIPIGTELRVPIDWLKEVLAGVKVNYVLGSASVQRRGSDEATALVADTMLNAGDKIITGVSSLVSLEFADNSTLLIDEQSEVIFDALSSFHGMGMLDTRIRLQRGRVENHVKPLQKPEFRFEIHTPAAVTMVRGTDFRVSSDAGDDMTRSEVTEGVVAVAAEGESVRVGQGEGTLIEKGMPPAAPRKLLAKPDLSDVIVHTTTQDILLEWSELGNATGYRYQLKESDGRLLAAGTTKAGSVRFPRMDPGSYHIEIRGIDELGLEGFGADYEFTLEPYLPLPAQTEPLVLKAPLLLQPQFSRYGIHLEWSPVKGVWAYRLLLARDVELSDVIFSGLAEGHSFFLQPPPPGQYYVGIEALSAVNDDLSRSNIYRIDIPAW
jgi:hypothetical protein